jgi:hypothetical protein
VRLEAGADFSGGGTLRSNARQGEGVGELIVGKCRRRRFET